MNSNENTSTIKHKNKFKVQHIKKVKHKDSIKLKVARNPEITCWVKKENIIQLNLENK